MKLKDNEIRSFETWIVCILCLIFCCIFIGKIIVNETAEPDLNLYGYNEYVSVDLRFNGLDRIALRITPDRRVKEIRDFKISIKYSILTPKHGVKEYDLTYSTELIKEEPAVYIFDSPEFAYQIDSYKVISISGEVNL